jgi:hypothetical protein
MPIKTPPRSNYADVLTLAGPYPSQSHQTDQGNSEGGLCNLLNLSDLAYLFLLPLEKRLPAALLTPLHGLLSLS